MITDLTTASLYIPVILGTARPGRISEAPAKLVLDTLAHEGVKTELIDVAKLDLDWNASLPVDLNDPHASASAKEFFVKMGKADGIVIVAPEYNHGYPGVLKHAFDHLDQSVCAHKPVGICGVSNGAMGGVRMVEQLRLVCIDLLLIPVKAAVYFANADKTFSSNGDLLDQSYSKKVEKFVSEMVWHAQALKMARETK